MSEHISYHPKFSIGPFFFQDSPFFRQSWIFCFNYLFPFWYYCQTFLKNKTVLLYCKICYQIFITSYLGWFSRIFIQEQNLYLRSLLLWELLFHETSFLFAYFRRNSFFHKMLCKVTWWFTSTTLILYWQHSAKLKHFSLFTRT